MSSPFLSYLQSRVAGRYKDFVALHPGPFHPIVVNEYPKSGGTWLCRMLARILGRTFESHRMFSPHNCIVHGHFGYSASLRNAVIVVRDGRDVMVSYYYHSFFEHELFNRHEVYENRRALSFDDYADIEANLPRFIEYAFTRKRFPFFTWSSFAEQWLPHVPDFVRYEDMLTDPFGVLTRVVARLGVDQPSDADIRAAIEEFSFERQSGRKTGNEDSSSFLRKGVAGDWQSKFTREAADIFQRLGGAALVRLGYEADATWVRRVADTPR